MPPNPSYLSNLSNVDLANVLDSSFSAFSQLTTLYGPLLRVLLPLGMSLYDIPPHSYANMSWESSFRLLSNSSLRGTIPAWVLTPTLSSLYVSPGVP